MNLFLAMFMVTAPTLSTTESADKQQMLEKELGGALVRAKEGQSNSIMIINSKERAEDYQKAFQILRDEKSTSKVFFELANGRKISNVIQMQVMPGNTLVLFRFTTPQGVKYEVAGIEDIMGISHQ